MNIPSRETVARLREQYPPGTRVELVRMNDPYNRKLKPGCRGTVRLVDSIGTLHVAWDCGSSLGVVYGEDEVKTVLPEAKQVAERLPTAQIKDLRRGTGIVKGGCDTHE